MFSSEDRVGFTFVETVLVVMILGVVATLAVSQVSGLREEARRTAAEHDLVTLREAFMDPATGYLRDLRGIPGFSLAHLRIGNLFIATNLYVDARIGDDVYEGRRLEDGWRESWQCALPAAFWFWDAERARGWRGPYVKNSNGGFPARTGIAVDGFYPPLEGLRVAEDFRNGYGGCSVYGFPGEPTLLDPWGHPYVLQIPPPQAFPGSNTNISDTVRFHYARIVSAGPDGILSTPCFGENKTNRWETSWNERTRRLSRQAGRVDGTDLSERGDDLVIFMERTDVDEGSDEG